MGKSFIGRSIRWKERYNTDEIFRDKYKQRRRKYYEKNKHKWREGQRKRERILSEFAGKKCRNCNKLLHYRTKGKLCKNCI